MKKLFAFLTLTFLTLSCFATTFYVDKAATGLNNGTSWANAWNNTTSIGWMSVKPGDVISIAGGSYSSFSIATNGANNNYITIARSLEAGKNGQVVIATPVIITGNYIKFDGGGYLNGKCGIVFTCSGNSTAIPGVPGGGAVSGNGVTPWFKYCYFNGTYAAGSGHSCGVANSTGFVLENCWFYQSVYEDQWVFAANGSGAKVCITNCVFQDNNKPNRTDTTHRDVANPWTGSGGWSLYLVGNIFFNTPGHASDQPQGDELLLQVGYGGSTTPMAEVLAINNVCYNTARFIAFGSSNSGVNSFKVYNNTIRSVINGSDIGITSTAPAPSPTSANNIGNSSNPGFLNATSPLGADGIPFTADDGFNLTAGSSAINAGSNIGVTTDIANKLRVGNPDLGAYEFNGTIVPPVTNPPSTIVLGESFKSTDGTILSPFIVNGALVSTPTTGGRAEYLFKVNTTGDYLTKILVNAPSLTENSLFINVNGEPIDPNHIWDIPVSANQIKNVNWRGIGAVDSNINGPPQIFKLVSGITNKLIILGRESNAAFGQISFVLTNQVVVPPTPGCTNTVYVTNTVTIPVISYVDRWFTNTVTVTQNYTNYIYSTNFVDRFFTNTIEVIPDLNTVIGILDKNNKVLNIQATFK
jgi:hypothetical protein